MNPRTPVLEASVVMIVVGTLALVASVTFPALTALIWLAAVLLGLAAVPHVLRRSHR